MRSWLVVAVLLALTGCGISDSLKGERQHISYYALSNTFRDPAGEQATGHVALELFSSEKPAGGLQLVRRTDEQTLEYYLYPENHLWWAAPAQLAHDFAVQHFRGQFRRVTRYPGRTEADVVLRIRLLQFEEIRGAGQSEGKALVVLSVEALPRNGEPVQFVTRTSAAIAHEDGYSVDGPLIAAALSKALSDALDKVTEQIKRPHP